jgi:hypothetical protein
VIILPSQIDHIDLSTAHLTISGPDLRAPYVILETAHIVLSLPTSPSLGLTYLDTAHIVLDAKTFPTPLPVVVFMPIASVVLSPISIGYLTTGGDDFNKIINTLRRGGSAPTTPPAFGACDQMDLINAVRAKTSLPAMSHSDSCMQSQLLHAFELGNPLPFEVPVIGTWCGDEEYPDIDPTVSKVLFKYGWETGFTKVDIATSTNGGRSFITLDIDGPPNVTSYLNRPVYIKKGIIFLTTYTPNVLYRGTKYGLIWNPVNISEYFTTPYELVVADGGNGTDLVFIRQDYGLGSPPAQIIRSANRGASWATQSFADSDYIYNIKIVSDSEVIMLKRNCSGPYNVYLTIAKSTDGGLTWVNKYTPVQPYDTHPILAIDNDIILCFDCGRYTYEMSWGSYLRSTDRGDTWTRVSSNIPIQGYIYQAVYLGDGMIVISGGYGATYKSSDYGLTWKSVFSGGEPLNNLIYLGNGEIVGSMYGYYGTMFIVRSINYGESFTKDESIRYTYGPLLYIDK